MNPIARLRIVQVGCILLALGCICISRLGHHEWRGTLAPRHWIVMAGVIWSAISGFTLQRRIVSWPVNSRRPSASTPFTRRRAGHIFRLWTAMTVGMGALLLSEFAGPPMIVNTFFALSLILLLVWTPGTVPDQTA